jgi:outer membrane immunogenic protein
MTRIAVFVLAVALSSLQAMAGDIYSRGSIKDTPAPLADAPAFNWTGLYVGAHGGYGMVNHDLTLTQDYEEHSAGVGIDGFGGEGLIGGAHIGADLQVGRIIGRVRFDYDVSDIETAARIFSGSDSLRASFEKSDEWMIWSGLGTPIGDRTQVYVMGGYGETTYELNGVEGVTFKQDYQGFGATGGIEHALANNVSLNLEGQYIMWDKADLIRGENFSLRDEPTELRIKAGASFRLGIGQFDPLN